MPNPEDWVSTVDPTTGSEFGGVPGLIQPAPHTMDVAETAAYARSIPADQMIQVGTDARGRPIMGFASTYEAPATDLIRP